MKSKTQPNDELDTDEIYGANTICSTTGNPVFNSHGVTIVGDPETGKATIPSGWDWPEGIDAVELALEQKVPVIFPANDNIDDEELLKRYARLHGGTVMGFGAERIVGDAVLDKSVGMIKILSGTGYFVPPVDNPTPIELPFPHEQKLRPIDPWAKARRPELPAGVLPPLIEEYAVAVGQQMGVDPGGATAAALAACAGAIPDSIKIKVKRHDDWTESARIWVALVGDPSAKKSPVISATTRQLRKIDGDLAREFSEALHAYEKLTKAEKANKLRPLNKRLVLEDTTIEAAQGVFADSPSGLILIRDELSGWFGAMEKYAGGKGSSADRAFWLQSFNGEPYSVSRVGRGSTYIHNLSAGLLGGIQPEPIRKIATDATDDGLLQRLFPIVLGGAKVGEDKPRGLIFGAFDDLIDRLYSMQQPRSGSLLVTHLRFDDRAQNYREELEKKHFDLMCAYESINKKIASHIGKYDGLFARLCVLFHCIECNGQTPETVVTFDTAERAGRFLHEFLFPHAVAFYRDVVGLTDKHDELLATAGFILSKRLEIITVRDVQRGDRKMREMDKKQATQVLERLEAMSWLEPMPLVRNETQQRWSVVDAVHDLFDERAAEERKTRQKTRELIQAGI